MFMFVFGWDKAMFHYEKLVRLAQSGSARLHANDCHLSILNVFAHCSLHLAEKYLQNRLNKNYKISKTVR